MKKLRLALIAVAGLILLAAGWSVFNHIYYGQKFDQRVAELKAQGYPVSLDDLEKTYVLPESVQNAADIYIQAFENYREPNEVEKSMLPYVGDYEFSADSEKLPAEVMDAMTAFLKRNEKTLELLDQAAAITHCLWPKTRQECMLFNDYFSQIKDSAQLLSLRNVYLSEMKEVNAVDRSLRSSIALANTCDIQPFLIDHLICIALKSVTVKNLNDVLTRMPIEAEKVEYFQKEFARMQSPGALHSAFVIDRVFTIEFWRLPYSKLGVDGLNPPSWWVKGINFCTGLIEKDAVLSLDHLEGYLQASALPLAERTYSFRQLDEERGLLSFLHAHLKNSVCFEPVNNIDLRVIGSLRCGETALAIERYRLKHNKLPESLEALVPEFITKVPLEPFDNEALRYVQHEVGYTVYTIGEDGVDNGGLSQEQMKKEKGQSDHKEYDWPFTVRR